MPYVDIAETCRRRAAMTPADLAGPNEERLAELAAIAEDTGERPTPESFAAARAVLAVEPHAFIYPDFGGGISLEWDRGDGSDAPLVWCDHRGQYSDERTDGLLTFEDVVARVRAWREA